MMVIPAVDVLDGRVVQLVGGVEGSQRISLPDPFAAAMSWAERGAPYLHLVDLDGAFGRGDNKEVFKRIVRECGVPVQIGGGIRSTEAAAELVDAGADRVVVGTRAVAEPEWLAELAEALPGRVVVGLDTRGGSIAVKGWREAAGISLDGMFELMRGLPLAAVLNTDVDVEGRQAGVDRERVADFVARCPFDVIASGGVAAEADVRALAAAGAKAAVVGLSLYTGAIRPWEWPAPWRG